jgi:anti-sigma B factor antagonist
VTGIDVRIDARDGVLVARPRGEIDLSNVAELRGALMRNLSNDALGAVLDLSETDYLDSAGINLFFELRERLRIRGPEMRVVVGPGSQVHDALRYAGALGSLVVSESVAAAVAELRP